MTATDSRFGFADHPSGLSIFSEEFASDLLIRHASTTRSYTSPSVSRLADLQKIREHLGSPDSFLAFGEQQHTNNVAIVTPDIIESNKKTGYWRFASTDAVVSSIQNVTLAIQTADCAPLFFYDQKSQVIALAHAGWKGTLASIAERTIGAMVDCGAVPARITAWLGPMAGRCCYEVSEELICQFHEQFPDFSSKQISSGRMLDLVEINTAQLLRAGLSASNISTSGVCTIHNKEKFYSYRADNGTHGRIISAIMMLPA